MENKVQPKTGFSVGISAEDRADARSGMDIVREQISNMTDEQLMVYLEQHNKSDVYTVINHIMDDSRRNALVKNISLSSRFKQVRKQAQEAWDHDHALAMNMDVDRVATYLYGTFLKMLKVQQEEIDTLTARIEQLESKPTHKSHKTVGDGNGTKK